jgi:hypothetical protein
MIVNASVPPTQALRIVPRVVPFRVLMPLPPIARHLCPRQSREPGGSSKMVTALAHRLWGDCG